MKLPKFSAVMGFLVSGYIGNAVGHPISGNPQNTNALTENNTTISELDSNNSNTALILIPNTCDIDEVARNLNTALQKFGEQCAQDAGPQFSVSSYYKGQIKNSTEIIKNIIDSVISLAVVITIASDFGLMAFTKVKESYSGFDKKNMTNNPHEGFASQSGTEDSTLSYDNVEAGLLG